MNLWLAPCWASSLNTPSARRSSLGNWSFVGSSLMLLLPTTLGHAAPRGATESIATLLD